MEPSFAWGRALLTIALGLYTLPTQPHFLWVTQFPLFTRADEDKEHLAKGRWSATHHPFTAPMFEDLEDLKQGKVESVSCPFSPDVASIGMLKLDTGPRTALRLGAEWPRDRWR